MSRVLFFALFLWLFVAFPALANSQVPAAGQMPFGRQSDLQEEALSMEEIEEYIRRLDGEIQKTVPEAGFRDFFEKAVKGELDFTPASIFQSISSCVFREVVANYALLGKLVILAIICAVLYNLTAAFERGTTGQLSSTVVYLVLTGLALGSFSVALNTGREAVEKMVSFMQALLPLLLTLLVALGGAASAAILHPVVLGSLTVIGTITKDVVLPLIFFAAVLGAAGNLSPGFRVSHLAGLLKTVAMGILGVFGTIFLGILAIRGAAAGVGDGITLRAAKFAVDAFVPFVGGFFADAFDAIISSSLLIKNAAGIAGMVAGLLIMSLPLLKILALALIYRLAGALVQPVGEGQVVDCLNDLGSSLLMVFAAVAIVGLLFFFAIAIIVGIGNLTVMIR
ncbi:MAG: stage III sporulation protein AE [Desulfotomaculales bacterium]